MVLHHIGDQVLSVDSAVSVLLHAFLYVILILPTTIKDVTSCMATQPH